MHRLYQFAIPLFVTGLLLAGCVVQPVASETEEAAAETPVALKVQTLPYLSFSPYFIAQEEGYFAEQGLDIEFVRFQRSSDAIPALLQGELDVLSGAISFGLLNAMAREPAIKLVADKGYAAADGCTDVTLLARADLLANKETARPFSGARVVVNPLSIRGYLLAEVLAQEGMTMDDLELIDIANPAVGEAFADEAIDYVVTAEPWTTRLLAQGVADVLIAAQDVVPDLQIGLVTYGPNLLTKAPAVGERFMVAYLQGVRQYNEGKTERNLEIISQYTELPMELLEAVCWGAMRSDGALNLESMLAFQAWGVATETVDTPVAEGALFEQRFIDYANQTLGTP